MPQAPETFILPEAGNKPLTIWAVSDGRAGIQNQVLGLAEAIARLTPAEITIKHIRYAPIFDRLPSALKLWPDAMLAATSDRFAPPYPDIWIAAGRATIPHSVQMRVRSNGRTLVVQCQDPKADQGAFDLIIAPEHDHVQEDNTLSLVGSTNRITARALSDGYAAWQARIEAFKPPFVTVLIGGRSKAYNLSPARAQRLAADVRQAVESTHGTLLLSLSRRTPEDAGQVLIKALKDLPGLIFDGTGDNPYFAFLHAADYVLLSEDSVNMATEAAATGKPIYILGLDKRPGHHSQKFTDFHATLRQSGIARSFEGRLETWTYPVLNETERAAQAVLELFHQKQANAPVNS